MSAIATGGVNAVVCDVPARDLAEFAAFPQAGPNISARFPDLQDVSVAFYRGWLDWAVDSNSRNPLFIPSY